jgi:OmcA/MtrC family decaheme c-type cytochrome
LQHRLTLQLSGSLNGGTLANPVNVIYDFVPATGAVIAAADVQREVVSIDSCNTCHEKLALHSGGGRVDTRYCVVCHTDQRKNGTVKVTSTDFKFPALTEKATVNPTTGITSYSYTPSTSVADGEVSGNFTTLIHKIHNGSALVKQNYNYANVAFNNKAFSMLGNGQKMCSTCHDSTKAKQADNWSTQPSRIACGSCHDGINFAEGTGKTLAQEAAGTNPGTGHAGINLKQTSDTACTICHTSDTTKEFHRTENITKHNPTIAAGLATMTYEIKSATVDSSNALTVVFKISKNGTPLDTLPPAGFTTSSRPSFLLSWAEAQDGVATPVDYNNKGVKQAQPKNPAITTGLTGPVDGYFTAVIPSDSAFPVGAKMRAVALQGYYTQAAGTDGIAVDTARHAISVVKAVTGDAVRRKVVDPAKCSNCHEWFEGHGGNRVYETQVCVMCHVPGMASSGRGMTDAKLAGYTFTAAQAKILADWKIATVAGKISPAPGSDTATTDFALRFPVTTNNFKDMIHGIHAGRDRVTSFMDARDGPSTRIALLDFKRMDFPGKLNNCQTCHVSTTAAATTFNTVPANTLASTYESINATYKATPTTAAAKTSLNTANPEDKVTTPYAAACVSCHNSLPGQAHMKLNGGQIQVERAFYAPANESCAVCHGPGKEQDAAVVHK